MSDTVPPSAGALAVLRSSFPGMTSTDQRIATVVLEDPEAILRSPVSEIASRSGSSPAAVSRFTARLGYKGLADFKIALALEVASGSTAVRGEPISAQDAPSQLLSKIARENRQAIRDTLEILPPDDLDRAVAVLGGARRIIVLGVGQMGYLAMDAAAKFTLAGRQAIASVDYVEQLSLCRSGGADDAVLCISYEGAAPPLLYNAEIARGRGAAVVGISHAGRPPLRELLDVHLPVSAHGTDWRTASAAAHVSIVTVLEALATGFLTADPNALAAAQETAALLRSEQLE